MIEACGILCLIGSVGWGAHALWPDFQTTHPRIFNKKMYGSLVTWIRRRTPTAYYDHWGGLLEQAGIASAEVYRFRTRRILFTVVGTFLGFMGWMANCPGILLVTLPAFGFAYVSFQLKGRIRKRKREILLSLPYYLDLLTLALEAGLDLLAAIEEVVENDSPNAFREELILTLNSIRVGTPRAQAFRELAKRTDIAPLALLTSSIIQSEELGSSLGHLFRLQAESLRAELFRQAEERAQRAPLKMLFPLVVFIFPAAFVVMCLPIAIRLFSLP